MQLPPRSQPVENVEQRLAMIADRLESLAEKADALFFQTQESRREYYKFSVQS